MLSGEVLAKCEEIIAESDEPIATKEMQVAVAVIKEIDVQQTNGEENKSQAMKKWNSSWMKYSTNYRRK